MVRAVSKGRRGRGSRCNKKNQSRAKRTKKEKPARVRDCYDGEYMGEFEHFCPFQFICCEFPRKWSVKQQNR